MQKLTITLDEETASWVRVYATNHNTSVTRMIGEMLAQRITHLRDYDRAMRRYLAKPPFRLKRSRKRYANRGELHDRGGLR